MVWRGSKILSISVDSWVWDEFLANMKERSQYIQMLVIKDRMQKKDDALRAQIQKAAPIETWTRADVATNNPTNSFISLLMQRRAEVIGREAYASSKA